MHTNGQVVINPFETGSYRFQVVWREAMTAGLLVLQAPGSPYRSSQDFSYPWARGLEGAKTESLVIVADFSDRVSGVSANPLEDVEVF